MSKKGEFSLDFTKFQDRIEKYQKLVEHDAAPEGVRQALNQLRIDANEKIPMTPFEFGALRGSGQVENVKRTRKTVEGEVSFGRANPARGIPELGYAARWHELPPEKVSLSKPQPGKVHFKTPGTGPKYLQSKMARYNEDYLEIIALHIRNVK